MSLQVARGSNGFIKRIFIQDASKTDGSGLAGLTPTSTGLVCWQMRDDAPGPTQITMVTAILGTWTSPDGTHAGLVEIDPVNCPGWYAFSIPTAALTAGSRTVDFILRGAVNMAPLAMEIELTGWDSQAVTVMAIPLTFTS